MLRKCISPIQILAAACVGTVSLLFCVVASAGEAAAPTEKTSTRRAPRVDYTKLDSDAILNALLALPPSERNKILVKLEQDLPGDARLPDRMKLAKDEEEPGAEEKKTADAPHEPEKWSMHYQGTAISQIHDSFPFAIRKSDQEFAD